jgi:hypothetical protein
VSLGAPAALSLRGSEHLRDVSNEASALAREVAARAAHLAALDEGALTALRDAATEASVVATLALDGAREHAAAITADAGSGERVGTWLDALEPMLGVEDEAEVARLVSLERAGAHAALDADDLMPAFSADHADPAGLGMAIGALHGRLTTGLVAAERAGMLRQGPRVVLDASIGRVLFFPTDAARLPTAWDALLRAAVEQTRHPDDAVRSAPVRSGALHLALLRHHPFDAANGRVARAASRMVLAADGFLPAGVVAPEVIVAEDPIAYLDGVAASVRRDDATTWVERWVETLGEALLRARDALDGALLQAGASAASDARGVDATVLAAVREVTVADDGSVTLAELATTLGGISVTQARSAASTAVLAGTLRRVLGTGGLRLRPAASPALLAEGRG